MTMDRLPPHDIDAEEAVLGSILISPETIFEIFPNLRPEDFYREKNAWVYRACLNLHDRNAAVNQITVAHEIDEQGKLEDVGGSAYLGYLISIVPTPLHIEHYALIVERASMRRRLIDAAGRIAALGYEGGDEVDVSLAKAEDLLYGLRSAGEARDFVHVREILDQYFEESVLVPREGDGRLGRVATGFSDLDKILGGLQRSELIVLAARPSMGKTSLAMNIAQHVAGKDKAKVAIFSLEMAKEQVVQRMLCGEARVDSQRLRLGFLNEEEERRIMKAMGVLSEVPIYIDDSALLKVAEMRSKIRRLHNEIGVDLVIVDYLQLMHAPGNFENRVQEISHISRSLKGLAREMNVPVLAVSQLSRAVETRTPHTPMLSDLRESGSIEQDADVVLFIYRDDMYYTEKEWEKTYPGKPFPKGIAQIIIAKHRNGPIGRVDLRFDEKTVRFADLVQKGSLL